MSWSPELSQGFEAQKCQHRVAGFLAGKGLDIGCGDKKIVETAIGVDVAGAAADFKLDLSIPDALEAFSDGHFDYVFSSHCLEDMTDWQGSLREWWRVIKFGGYLVLYGPDPDFYPRVGTAGANPNHKVDLYWQDVWDCIAKCGNAKKVHSSRHNESNEYSWQLVIQKTYSFRQRVSAWIRPETVAKPLALPREKKGKKEVLVIRYGAFGDAVWMTPVLRQLKADGWYVVYNTNEYSAQVLKHCPWIDEFMLQPQDGIHMDDLPAYWEGLEGHFDKVINMSGSVEGTLLKKEGSDEYKWPHNRRHKECNVNYQDQTMAWAGYPQMKGELPELHFTESEETMMQHFLGAHREGKFLVVWSLSGSSFHKHYPWTPYVTGEIAANHDDVVIVTVGDNDCQIIEPRTPNVIPKAGHLPIRYSMMLTKYADLVVGPETGVLNAAACWDTPKIVFLSHSSEENLTKYWKNVTPLRAKGVPCQPCHRLIYSNSCPKGKDDIAPMCVENLSAQQVYDAFLKYYKQWKDTQC